jgi:uncharacterized protein (TIGR03437 family)
MFWLRALSLFVPAALCAQQLTFATYQGGSGDENASGVALDSSGNVYLAGTTGSTNFPSSSTAGGGFVVKLNSAGQRQAAMLLPGVAINGIAIDPSGDAVVAGTMSAGALAPSKGAYSTPNPTGFAAKLNSTLTQTLWTATFSASPAALAVDSSGAVYVTGSAVAGFVTTPGAAQTSFGGGASDAFVLKLSADGSTVVYATFLGGSQEDTATAIAVDSAGQVYITGATASSDFPLANPQQTFGGRLSNFESTPDWYGDAFVAKLDPKGANLLYSTYLGGVAADQGNAIAVDSSGNAYVAGGTESASFLAGPAKGTYQTAYAGPAPDPTAPFPDGDAFLAKFSSAGALLWYTYLGGSGYDGAFAIALDTAGDIYLAGYTDSTNFPQAGIQVHDCHIGERPFLAELDPKGAKLLMTTDVGGMGADDAYAMAFDSAHNVVYLAGDAASQVFFATPGAAQTAFGGGDSDAFVARIDLTVQPSLVVSCVLNGASFMAGNTSPFPTGDVAPGEIVSLFGLGLGPTTAAGLQLTSAGTVATTLGGTKVLFDGVPAPLLYSANGQVNAVVPYEVASPVTQMTVESGGLSYGPIPMPVVAAVPAIFLAGDPSNPSEAAAINPDGTLNSVSNPVARGSYVTFYACGVGLMTTNSDGAVTPGTPPWPAPQLQPVTVAIRGFNATVQYAGAAPGYVSGLLQINVFVPGPDQINSDLHVPLFLTIGNYTTQDNVTIAIQ